MQAIVSILGPTGAGKSSVVRALQGLSEEVYPIQIGKELRRRHPEESFQGSATSDEMTEEKWHIWDDLIAEAPKNAVIVVDGMPRAPKEMDHYAYRTIVFDSIVLLDADVKIREQRLSARDHDSSLEHRALWRSRLEADYQLFYSGLSAYMNHIGNDYFITVQGYNTEHLSPEAIAKAILVDIERYPRT